jgi:DNA-binding transcriptional MerR regulator
MDIYEYETREIIKRFREKTITLHECVAALNAALAGAVPQLTCDQLPRLQVLLRENNETVLREMDRRFFPPSARSQTAG